jgi:hypothetical protein
MNFDIARHGRSATGSLHTVLGGADEVGINATSRPLAKIAAPHATVETIPGAPHELSQEWQDPRVVDAFERAVLGSTSGLAARRINPQP